MTWVGTFVFDWAELLQVNLLDPLRRGEPVDFRPDAWAARDRKGSIRIPAGLDVVWVEGTGSSRRELSHRVDASIRIQADKAEAERRLVLRDGEAHELLRQEWEKEEVTFLLADRPWNRANIIVAGTPVPECIAAGHIAVARLLPQTLKVPEVKGGTHSWLIQRHLNYGASSSPRFDSLAPAASIGLEHPCSTMQAGGEGAPKGSPYRCPPCGFPRDYRGAGKGALCFPGFAGEEKGKDRGFHDSPKSSVSAGLRGGFAWHDCPRRLPAGDGQAP